jgi:hypothetical protein
MVLGIVAWNLVLNLTNARAMNVDSAYRVSGQDVGSGVFAFAVGALALGLITDRRAGRAGHRRRGHRRHHHHRRGSLRVKHG